MEAASACPNGRHFLVRVKFLLKLSLMGCGTSTCLSTSNGCHRNKIEHLSNDIEVIVGSHIDTSLRPLLVFVLGGPGSKKGLIINNLVAAFGFTYLSWDAGSKDVSAETELTILSKGLKESIQTNKSEKFLVDVIPNFNIPTVNHFQHKNVCNFFASLEAQFKISFALALKFSYAKKSKEPLNNSTYNKIADEIDILRLKKRASIYDKSIESFLDFFGYSGRLITVDVSSGHKELVWQRIYGIFMRLNIPLKNTVNSILIFKFCTVPDVVDAIISHRINLRAEIPDINNLTIDELLEKLMMLIRRKHHYANEFIIEAVDTPLVCATNYEKKKVIEVTFDDQRLNTNWTCMDLKKFNYKAVVSLEDEIFIFPTEIHDKICNYIAKTLAQLRRN